MAAKRSMAAAISSEVEIQLRSSTSCSALILCRERKEAATLSFEDLAVKVHFINVSRGCGSGVSAEDKASQSRR